MKVQANRKIKVLETIRQGLIGGGESHVLGLVGQLDKSRFEPFVLSFTEGQMIEKLNEQRIRNYVIPSTKPFDITKWQQVKALLKKERIDLVHVHGTRAASNLLWVAKSLRIPVVYTIHGWSFHDDQQPVVKKIRILSEQFITRRTAINISVSASNQATGEKCFGDFRSIVINNGIDPEKFNPDRNDYHDIRSEFNIPQACPLIVYIARITRQKDPLTMIRAFRKVADARPDARLLMVGDGELKEQAVQLAKELSLQEHIIFTPFREDIPAILKAADIYCLPSLWEGLPIGLLEAMAMGKAVVATKVDGSKEIIRHGENGLLTEPGSPQALADTILHLCDNTEFQQRLSRQATSTIERQFNVATMTRQIETVYDNVLSGN